MDAEESVKRNFEGKVFYVEWENYKGSIKIIKLDQYKYDSSYDVAFCHFRYERVAGAEVDDLINILKSDEDSHLIHADNFVFYPYHDRDNILFGELLSSEEWNKNIKGFIL